MLFEVEFDSKTNIRFTFGKENFLVWKRRNATTFEILWLFVEEDFRRRKVATRLLLFSFLVMLDWYPQMKRVFVDDMSDNATSIRNNVYRKFGFKSLGYEKKAVTINSLFRRHYLFKVFTEILKRHVYLPF
jgi:GNAT superfamily N-acetyltransferase